MQVYHEAGHAVVAHALGIRLRYVSQSETKLRINEDELLDDSREGLITKFTYTTAGRIAAYLALGRGLIPDTGTAPDFGAYDDERKMLEVARATQLSNSHLTRYMGEAARQATHVLSTRWSAVTALAGELMQRERIDGEEAERIIKAAFE